MKYIGITGPTGAGKTTALEVLEELGAVVIDADAVYHRLTRESAPLRRALASAFGADILDGAGQLDRKRLGSKVFGDPAALARLNGITHPYIMEEIDRLAAEGERAGKQAAAIDAIALIESGTAQRCEAVVGILADPQVRVARIMAREGISEDYARRRVAAQPDEAFYRAHCTHILENNGNDPQEFRQRARGLFVLFLERKRTQKELPSAPSPG